MGKKKATRPKTGGTSSQIQKGERRPVTEDQHVAAVLPSAGARYTRTCGAIGKSNINMSLKSLFNRPVEPMSTSFSKKY
jgi:hypothetical protein